MPFFDDGGEVFGNLLEAGGVGEVFAGADAAVVEEFYAFAGAFEDAEASGGGAWVEADDFHSRDAVTLSNSGCLFISCSMARATR